MNANYLDYDGDVISGITKNIPKQLCVLKCQPSIHNMIGFFDITEYKKELLLEFEWMFHRYSVRFALIALGECPENPHDKSAICNIYIGFSDFKTPNGKCCWYNNTLWVYDDWHVRKQSNNAKMPFDVLSKIMEKHPALYDFVANDRHIILAAHGKMRNA